MWIGDHPCPISEQICRRYDDGYGYKRLARELGTTVTVLRRICNEYIGFVGRTGQNVVTDKLRETRRQNVLGEKSPWYDWPKRKPEMAAKTGRSIQGWFTKRDGTSVWLRSTYEYVFAKWLDKIGADWRMEERVFTLSTGERYRPDFFIYRNGVLACIVEVKSRYFNRDNREYKFHLFKQEYGIECMLITDITRFIDLNLTYHQELRAWKQQRSLAR